MEPENPIDFRSDTVTRPTLEMRKAMADAEVGDDVYGDDPTVLRLQKIAAEMTGQDAALFFPSGTQANLSALMSHCQRGDEYLCGQEAHIYKYEGGGGAVLGSIQPQPIENEKDGSLSLEKLEAALKERGNVHFPVSRLLALENTITGRVLGLEYMRDAVAFARKTGLGTHLDGARIFNAATALNVEVGEISSMFDSVSVCLSKGLCAPAGTVLCGRREIIEKALRWRKMLGGGMRQAGILAAAGILAIVKMSKRLAEDHQKAADFAEILKSGTSLEPTHHTCFVLVDFDENQMKRIEEAFSAQNIKASLSHKTRFAFHRDISPEAALETAKIIVGALQ